MNNLTKVLAMLLCLAMCLPLTACTLGGGETTAPPDTMQPSTTPTSPSINTEPVYGEYDKTILYDRIWGNERKYTQEEFQDPAVFYRMLAVLNDDATNPKGASIPNIRNLKKWGYGGVVTNVSWGQDYLRNDMAWESLVDTISYTIEDLGLRVMLYDEKYYPSGAAGGLTLKENMDWQAWGLSNKALPIKPGKSGTLSQPEGYTLVSAIAYKGSTLADLDLTTGVQCEVSSANAASFTNTTQDSYVMVCLYKKYWYEGTHPQWNIMQSRRYIDLTNPAPTQAFLENTYELYKKYLGQYFNNGIENFFFDEPAMAGSYKGSCTQVYNPDPDSVPNNNMELLDTVNFGFTVLERFRKDWGYDITEYFPYLFTSGNDLNSSEEAMRARWHYHQTLADMVAESYFGQIGQWCAENNISSSGHMLSEESMAASAVYSGNLFRDYAAMQIPGIDLLSGNPNSVARGGYLLALKTVSSSAQYDGKQRVFCEISDWGDENTDWNARIAAVAVQYAYGINDFCSYYTPFNYDEATNRKLTDTTARIGYMLGGGVSEKNVLIYYPIESVYASTANGTSNKYVNAITNNFVKLIEKLSLENIDYLLADTSNILGGKLENGKFVTPSGMEFETIVIPQTTCMPYALLEKLSELAQGGVKVVMQNTNDILCETEDRQDSFNQLLASLVANANSVHKASVNEIYSFIENECDARYVWVQNQTGGSEPIVAVKHKNTNNSVYIIVNTNSSAQTLTITLSDTGTVMAWDPTTGTVTEIAAEANGSMTDITVTLDGYGCMLYTIA